MLLFAIKRMREWDIKVSGTKTWSGKRGRDFKGDVGGAYDQSSMLRTSEKNPPTFKKDNSRR